MPTPNVQNPLVVTGLFASSGDQRWNQAEGWENAIGEIGQLDTGRGINLLEWSPTGKYALIGQAADFSVWDMESWQCLYECADTDVACLAFSADGERLFSGLKNGNVVDWDMKTGREISVIETGAAAILRLVHSPARPYMVTYNSEGRLRLWDVTERSAIRALGEGRTQVLDVVCKSVGWDACRAHFAVPDSLMMSAGIESHAGTGRGDPIIGTDPIVGQRENEQLIEIYRFEADGTGLRQSRGDNDRAFRWKRVGESVQSTFLLPTGEPSNYGDTFLLDNGVRRAVQCLKPGGHLC